MGVVTWTMKDWRGQGKKDVTVRVTIDQEELERKLLRKLNENVGKKTKLLGGAIEMELLSVKEAKE